ncbi:PLDc N-terminal domain-containing protein [Candidatus Wolfebacteria bacterium]|nr:PLDc N-terminal domain-containing protein [Candidatus Wolfebacteria bacterium]
MMIVHAARHPINNKGVWIVVMIFTGIVGALIYYFTVKRKFNQQYSQSTITAPK